MTCHCGTWCRAGAEWAGRVGLRAGGDVCMRNYGNIERLERIERRQTSWISLRLLYLNYWLHEAGSNRCF